MSRRSRFFRSGLMCAVGSFVVGIAFFAVPAHAATCTTDCYVVTPVAPPGSVTPPASAAAGTGQQYAFQVTNNDPNEYLTSLTFTAPTDFAITSASGPGEPSKLPAPSVTLDFSSNPGITFTIDVTALAPCVTTGTGAWGVSGIDTLQETNEVQWSSSPLSTPVTGQCSLKFTGEPAQTAVNFKITTGFNSAGDPLTVQLLDANNPPHPLNPADVSANDTKVTVSISTNPGGGTLPRGTTTVASSNGVATFGNLQIDKPGVGYDLAAAASGFTSATSSLFTIAGQIQPCTASCSASQSTATTGTSITTTSASGDFAALSLGGVSFTCNNYKSVSDTATFGVFNSSGGGVASASATVTLTISAAAVASSPRPLIFWQVCYAAPTSFPVIPGTGGTTTIAGTTYHTGLLLPCFLFSPGHPEPCLISQRKADTGAVTLTFIAFGDPFYRG